MPLIDMSNVSSGFEPLPDGEYEAVFSEFQYIAKSASSGNPYVKMVYTIDGDEFGGRKLFRNRSLQAQSLWALKQDAIALGGDPEEWSGEVDLEESLGSLIGERALVGVRARTFTDDSGEEKTSNEITKVKPAPAF